MADLGALLVCKLRHHLLHCFNAPMYFHHVAPKHALTNFGCDHLSWLCLGAAHMCYLRNCRLDCALGPCKLQPPAFILRIVFLGTTALMSGLREAGRKGGVRSDNASRLDLRTLSAVRGERRRPASLSASFVGRPSCSESPDTVSRCRLQSMGWDAFLPNHAQELQPTILPPAKKPSGCRDVPSLTCLPSRRAHG